MSDLRDDLIRLAEEYEAHAARIPWGDKCDALMTHAQDIRQILASHPAPSPSVSRDAETCRERSSVGHGDLDRIERRAEAFAAKE